MWCRDVGGCRSYLGQCILLPFGKFVVTVECLTVVVESFVIGVVVVFLDVVVDIFEPGRVVVVCVQVGVVPVVVEVVVVACGVLVVFARLPGEGQLRLVHVVEEVLVVDFGGAFLGAAAEVPFELVLVECQVVVMTMMLLRKRQVR